MKKIVYLVSLLFIGTRLFAQDGYQTAMNRIAAARASGATSLSLENLSLDSLPPEIQTLKGLKTLRLSNNQLQQIESLRYLTHLEWLDASENQIKDISPLEHLQQLVDLNLSNNQISDISALKGLKKLASLWLEHNEIRDISPLRDLKELATLNLPNNQIQVFQLDLNLFPKLTWLQLYDNPIRNVPKEAFEHTDCLPKIKMYQKYSNR